MSLWIRCLGYVLGAAWWMFLRIPRYDSERRSSTRYRNALRITRKIWIGSCCLMLLVLDTLPEHGVSLSLVLMLATAFLSYMILDETE